MYGSLNRHLGFSFETFVALISVLAVALEEVERMAVVRDLPRSVGAAPRRRERALCSATDGRLAGRSEGRPVDGAGAVALAHRSGVPAEQIERAAARVDEDVAEAGV